MRLFQALLLDEHLEDGGSGQTVVTSNGWSLLLARAESLKFTCIADAISGATTPNVRIDLLGTNSDGLGEFTKTLLDQAIQPGVNSDVLPYGPADTNYPPPRYLAVAVSISGGSGRKAHVQLWVCGRGPQLLEAIPPASASFSAQYAAAKMLDEEDSVSLKKQSLRPGANLFYPPELFESALRWER